AEGFRNTAAGKQSLNMEGLSWKLNSEDAGFGRLIVLKNLNPGEYSLTAVHPEVQDSVSVDFTITKPDIVIGLNDGFIYNAGTKLKLSAKIPAGVILKWYIDGNETASGNNTEIIPDVNEGQHVLTARGQLGTTELESSISFSVNRLPVIVLNSPLDGKEYGKGEEIYILPEVTDPEGKNVKVTYTLDSKSYSGDRIMTSMLIPGVHRFGVYAQDENGGKSQAEIKFTVIDGPKVYINSPTDGSNFMVNESIPVSFTSEGRNVSLQWYLDESEIYDESIYFERAGNHKLKVIATDEFDNTATSEVSFSVLNSGVLRILSPKDGSVINSGDNILLRAEAFGIQNAETVTWLIDGINAGEGAELAVSSEGLESGAHIINALISDLNQKVTFGINTKPEIALNRSDIVYLRGSSYEIKANVSDKEKNVKNENIKWNIDGKEVYRGEYFNLITVNPEAGEHILTVSVTDDMGMYSEITVNIKVIEKMGVSFKGISEKQIITKKMSAESSVSGGLPPYTFKWQIIQT
ncbi:MAG TPA: hypothetical protein PLS66_04750, partial [Tepiditoga sp.]|nr:hypothetical protein [Tepiditoga sp.]